MTQERFRQAFLLLLVVAVSVAFIAMVRSFVVTILMAAIFAGVSQPIYLRLRRRLRGSRVLASIGTILVLLVVVFVPVFGLVGAIANEALQVSENVRPWIEGVIAEPTRIDAYVARIPFVEDVDAARAEIVRRGGELVGNVSTFLFRTLSAMTRGTVVFFFHLFILLYAMFFFLMDGKRMLQGALAYLPLSEEDKAVMLDRFISVARATLKGTLLIGLIQGTLGGLAFWVAGIEGAIFWGALMVVASIIPAIGPALIWIPAVIVLVIQGAMLKAIGLGLFCAVVVGLTDNALRPRFVGRDTKMHDLLILLSTLGGIILLGASGLIIGPILAALFITIWGMFRVAFGDVLPAVHVEETE